MTDRTPTCPDEDDLVAFTLGELDGRLRAETLAHLADCPACRSQVQELAEVVDQVLLAGPVAEPPEGFEAGVLDQLRVHGGTSRRRIGRALLAVAAAIVLVIGLAAVLVVTDDAPAIAEARMVTPSGHDVGAAWRYSDDSSWVFVSVPGWRRWEEPGGAPGDYMLRAVLDDGTTVELGEITFGDADGSWGVTTEIDAARIRTVSIADDTGHVWCTGSF